MELKAASHQHVLRGVWLGRRRYEPVHALQQALHDKRRRGMLPDTVLFVEHEPVITLGRGASRAHLLATPTELRAHGIEQIEVGRGGDVTLHAPGQLVCYPILELSGARRDVRRYVKDLTECMRRTAADLNVSSGPIDSYIGLWVDAQNPQSFRGAQHATELKKLGAVGVKISRWVTMHGFALNLSVDLDLFNWIVPCGIRQHSVTSVLELTAQEADVYAAARGALAHLARIWEAHAPPLENAADQALTAIGS